MRKPSWTLFKKKIREHQLASGSWNSDQKYLLEIAEQARCWGLDPKSACKAGISNLRNIVHVARKAIDRNDRTRLAQLFDQAAYLTMGELRVAVGQVQPEQIPFHQVSTPIPAYHVTMTADQLRRVQASHKHRFQFVPELRVEA
jgi:hypothetical protein